MEELPIIGKGVKKKPNQKKLRKIKKMIIREYEDMASPAFSKSSSVVKRVLLKKHPSLFFNVSDNFVKDTLEEQSSTYSRTRVRQKNKYFFGTSFYSNHPHYRWHVDLQDMSIFKKSKISTRYNFMLICVDDFSNYIMVRLLRNKNAKSVHNAIIDIIKAEKTIPTIIYCDQGSEFKNKLFDDPKGNGFRVQFTVDRRKAVYAERAIRTIRRSLEQLYLIHPSTSIETAVKSVVSSHNNAPSRRNPIHNGMHASPSEVVKDPQISDEMEMLLRQRREDQYKTNIAKKVILRKPKFNIGEMVRYLKRRSKFSKESSLTGNWSDKIFQIHSINSAHPFKTMHTYTLSELGTNKPSIDLPPIQEDFLKKARINQNDKFIVEKVLDKKGNEVLVKWLDYEVPTWEPKSAIPTRLIPKAWRDHKD